MILFNLLRGNQKRSLNLVTIPAAYAKSGKTRSVPLNAVIRAALERLKEGEQGQGDYVFSKRDGSPYRSIRTAFNNAVNRAKLTDVTIHTLRHTFASRLTMVGVDLRTIQELGGWSNLEMVQRYSHLSQSHKAEAVEKSPRIPQRFSQHMVKSHLRQTT